MRFIDQLDGAAPAAEELDRHLLAAKGISAAEMARMLGHPCLAGTVALALEALLPPDSPRRAELARTIAAEGLEEVRVRLAAVYAAALAAEPQGLTVASYCDAYLRGEGREDAVMLQFAADNGEAIEAEFQRRAEASRPPAKPKRKRR